MDCITTPCAVQLGHLFNQCCSLQTYDGIDTCGNRLAAEIKHKVKEHPALQNISLLGHSMGGLLVRYAAGGRCTLVNFCVLLTSKALSNTAFGLKQHIDRTTVSFAVSIVKGYMCWKTLIMHSPLFQWLGHAQSCMQMQAQWDRHT